MERDRDEIIKAMDKVRNVVRDRREAGDDVVGVAVFELFDEFGHESVFASDCESAVDGVRREAAMVSNAVDRWFVTNSAFLSGVKVDGLSKALTTEIRAWLMASQTGWREE